MFLEEFFAKFYLKKKVWNFFATFPIGKTSEYWETKRPLMEFVSLYKVWWSFVLAIWQPYPYYITTVV
jgi:hypothetical protein